MNSKTSLWNLVKDRYYSAINILGLAAGLTLTILITLLIQDELYEHVYHLESDFTLDNKNHKFAATQIPLVPTLIDEYPEIIDYARCAPVGTLTL